MTKKFKYTSFLGPKEGSDFNLVPVMSIEGNAKLDSVEVPNTLPILTLRDAVLFPGTILPVTIGREKSLKLIKAMEQSTKIIGTATQKDVTTDNPTIDDLYPIGTSAQILKLIDMPDDTYTVVLQGIRRFKIDSVVTYDPYIIGNITELKDEVPDEKEINTSFKAL